MSRRSNTCFALSSAFIAFATSVLGETQNVQLVQFALDREGIEPMAWTAVELTVSAPAAYEKRRAAGRFGWLLVSSQKHAQESR